MKKLFSLFLILCAIAAPSLAEVDLSGMSFDELVALREQIDLAIWNCAEWQEVTVPQGLWKVGEDIPEGHWTITPVDSAWASVDYGSDLEANGKDISYRSKNHYAENLVSKTSRIYEAGSDCSVMDIVAEAGSYIRIDNGDVVFTPYTGKPSLGFK